MKNTLALAIALPLPFLINVPQAAANCNISDAMLEQAILQKPEFRDQVNRQMVVDLRTLRDAAFILWSYGF
ncbi:PRC-barrel domain containing protein, partial [Rhizobium ruizarguesonis]